MANAELHLELNLRKARQLDGLIGKQIASLTTLELATTNDVRVKSTVQEAEMALDSAQNKFDLSLGAVVKLIRLRFQLRRQIEKANEASGLNSDMNNREEHLALSRVYNNFPKTVSASVRLPSAQLREELETRARFLERSTESYNIQTSVAANFLTSEAATALERRKKDLARRISELEDTLGQKNLGTKISLGAEDVRLLESQGLL